MTDSGDAGNSTEMLETFTVTVIEEIKRSAEEGTLDVPIISIKFNGNKFDIIEESIEQPTTPENKSHVEVDRHPESKSQNYRIVILTFLLNYQGP